MIFFTGLLHGDLGLSIATRRPVMEDVKQYIPATIELATTAALMTALVGIPFGILAAVFRDTWLDHVARIISLIGVSAPTFWLAFIVLALFYGGLQIAPSPGRLDIGEIPPPDVSGFYTIDSVLAKDWETLRSALAHLFLPAAVLAASTIGLITRTTRASMLEALNQDYVRIARAKGLVERSVIVGHALPNALIPVITLGGLAYAELLAGTVMTETIFSWPGLGKYSFQAALALDFPAIMAVTFIVALIYLFVNLIVDMTYAVLDPRVVRR
jgi:peptide/nickel transport system permease protein